ncbi:MAG: T9SS type A sorting domain-containing protein [Bacteroidales bacterium]|nr:T9SS type A sorting domain-containing protein [Bacteroidales bacterium]
MKIKLKILIINLVLISFSALSQSNIKVMSYNLLNFGNYTSYCTSTNNPHEDKADYLATIVNNQQPDIIAVCELGKGPNANYMTNFILGNSLNINGEIKWLAAAPTDQSGSYLINGLYYDSNKFQLMSQPVVKTDVRDINIYKLKCLQIEEETFFYVVVMHLKAGSSSSDESGRAAMITKLMNYLSTFGNNTNFIVVGDLNVYKNTEPAFQNLINPSNPSLAFYDPINKLGDWNNNYEFKDYHTQSTRDDSNNSCFSYGGMDDRFDWILISSTLKDGTADIKYIEDTYWAVGQDGNRFNGNLINPTNTSLPSDVINALYNMSDHLPVVAEFQIGDNSSISSMSSTPDFYANVVNPTDGIIRYQLKSNLQRKIEVNIYSGVGQKIYTTSINSKNADIQAIDISGFANGIYIMSFKGEGISQSYKIVKK